MRLEHGKISELKKAILAIIARHLDLEQHQIFFFGSRVTGRGDAHSDIDVGILGSKPLGTGVLSDIQDEVNELPTLYKIDMVDFYGVSDKFKQVALEKTEIIN